MHLCSACNRHTTNALDDDDDDDDTTKAAKIKKVLLLRALVPNVGVNYPNSVMGPFHLDNWLSFLSVF